MGNEFYRVRERNWHKKFITVCMVRKDNFKTTKHANENSNQVLVEIRL